MGRYNFEEKLKFIRYSVIAFNTIALMLAISLLGLCIWMKVSSDVQDRISDMKLGIVYIGIYIFLVGSILAIIFIVIGCFAVMSESVTWLRVYVGFQIFVFILGIVGSALLLDFTTINSKLQPLVRDSMIYLIVESRWDRNAETLRLIQENIGCCGADGPSDYVKWKKPLPDHCRDAVTGNAYFHGCVEEFTWSLEEKSKWIAAISMVLCFINVLDIVCTLILIKAKKLESVSFIGK